MCASNASVVTLDCADCAIDHESLSPSYIYKHVALKMITIIVANVIIV
jgi:hypothetical protein